MTVDPNTAPLSGEKLLPCPLCGETLEIRGGVNPYGRHSKDSECLLAARAVSIPIDVAAWNRRSRAQDDTSREGEKELVERIARAVSQRFPAGDGSAPDEAWYWSTLNDHPGNELAHECREDDRRIARWAISALSRPLEAAPVDGGEAVAFAISSFFTERRSEFERAGTVVYHQPMGMATMPLYAHPAGTDAKRIAELEEMVAGSIPAYRLMQKRAEAAEAQLAALTDKSGNAELIEAVTFARTAFAWIMQAAHGQGPLSRANDHDTIDAMHPLAEEADGKLRAALCSPAPDRMETAAARDVLAERERQKAVEGWTPEHDDKYTHGELPSAAACYAVPEAAYWGPSRDRSALRWPWQVQWWKSGDPRRNLVKSGALILAEIERLDRGASINKEEGE